MRAVRRLFAISTVLSVLLCAAVVIAWVQSEHDEDDACTFRLSGARHTLHSTRGRLTVMGTPRDGDDDPIGLDGRLPDYFEKASKEGAFAQELANRIRNEDVQWVRVPSGGSSIKDAYATCNILAGTPSFELLERFDNREGILAVAPALFGALDDPERFLAAHALLRSFRFGPFDGRPGGVFRQQGSGIVADFDGLPLTFDPSQPGTLMPDQSCREKLRDMWHEKLDTRVFSLWYGTIVFSTTLLPIAWLTRPRRKPRTIRRWAFTNVALASSVLFVTSIVGWWQSGRGGCDVGAWYNAPSREGPRELWTLLASKDGVCMLFFYHVEKQMGEFAPLRDIDLALPAWVRPAALLSPYHLHGGFAFRVRKYQPDPLRVPKRSVIVSSPYWALALAFLLVPAAWVWQWFRTLCRRPGLCASCGYDLRATPERCPECGEVTVNHDRTTSTGATH